MSKLPLVVRAGAGARARLAREGFVPDAIHTLVGASGGPKWMVLSQLDRVWLRRLLRPRSAPLHLLGSSIGSFRHAAFAQREPEAALDRLEEAYIGQVYAEDHFPPPEEVTLGTRKVHDALLGAKGAEEIAANPLLHSHIVTARLRGPRGLVHDRGWRLRLALGGAGLANTAARPALGAVFERAVFSSAGSPGPALGGARVALSPENLGPALLASGSIPLVMEGVPDPPGAAPGFYFDGGIIDYHFDFAFAARGSADRDGLVLFPHFFDRITPGWMDKALPWRKPRAVDMDRVWMVAPSDAFVRSLPGAKVPDRKDFEELGTDERQGRWRDVVARCRELAEALEEVLKDPARHARDFAGVAR